jgi:hypothetical protein
LAFVRGSTSYAQLLFITFNICNFIGQRFRGGTLNIEHLLLTSVLNQCSAVVPGDWNTEYQLFAKPLALAAK